LRFELNGLQRRGKHSPIRRVGLQLATGSLEGLLKKLLVRRCVDNETQTPQRYGVEQFLDLKNVTSVRIKTLPRNPENVLCGLKEAGKA